MTLREVLEDMKEQQSASRPPDDLQCLAVLVVIGLLFLNAMSFYPVHRARAAVAEALSFGSFLAMGMTEYRASTGRWPEDDAAQASVSGSHGDAGLGKYADKADIDSGGGIRISFRDDAGRLAGTALSFRAAVSTFSEDAPVLWLCGYRPPPAGYRAEAENHTTVSASLLPAVCLAPEPVT